jgi:cytosine/adenosine deaminase-related metal-dependent hydrolase
MIVRARVVVTMDGPPIEDGAVAISGDKVVDVGKFSEISPRQSGEEVVDLGDQTLLPGLINAHCHLDYTSLRGKIPPPTSFVDWIRRINAEKAKLSTADYLASINEGFAEAKRFGTTTIANLTAFPELIRQIQDEIRTWWFAELIDVRDVERANEVVDRAVASLRWTENRGLAPHTLFTASPNLFRRCDELAGRDKMLLTTHLAESREEMSMFHDASGALYEFVKGIGRNMSDCGGKTPLEKFVGRLEKTSPPWIVAHLNELSESDFDLLARSTNKFHVVHCPRSHKYFGHSPFRFERLAALGFHICLGTDSLASNDDLSLFAEMREFQKRFPGVSPKEILSMVTLNPARALARQPALGQIKPGACADLIAIPIDGEGGIFERVLAFEGTVPWTMVEGHTRKLL